MADVRAPEAEGEAVVADAMALVEDDPPLVSLAWLTLEYSTHQCLGSLSCCSQALRRESQNENLRARLVFRRWRLPARASPRVYGGSSWPMVYQNLAHTQKGPRLRSVSGHTVFARGKALKKGGKGVDCGAGASSGTAQTANRSAAAPRLPCPRRRRQQHGASGRRRRA